MGVRLFFVCGFLNYSLYRLSLNVGQRELSEAGNDVSSSISSSKLPLPGKVLEMFNSKHKKERVIIDGLANKSPLPAQTYPQSFMQRERGESPN